MLLFCCEVGWSALTPTTIGISNDYGRLLLTDVPSARLQNGAFNGAKILVVKITAGRVQGRAQAHYLDHMPCKNRICSDEWPPEK